VQGAQTQQVTSISHTAGTQMEPWLPLCTDSYDIRW